jgi:multidrug efflux pump subunit AcrA (membrane-fusion protein)
MTVPVTRGELTASVSATGNIRSANQVDLNFQTGGIVQEVLVKTGDVVTKGQPLVRLDTMDLALTVKNDEAALETAQLKLEEAREGASEADLLAAQSKVDSAQAALDALSTGPTSTEVAEAQSRLASARASLEKAKAGSTEVEVANARNQVETAKNSLWSSQSSRDAICGRTKDPDQDTSCNQARAAVNNAELGVQTAQNNLEKLLAGPNTNDVFIAEQNVRQAELSLAKLRQPPTEDKIAAAQANLVQAQTALDELKAGPNSRTVRQAEITVTQAQSKLEQSQLKLQQATLVAPAAGPPLGLSRPSRRQSASAWARRATPSRWWT